VPQPIAPPHAPKIQVSGAKMGAHEALKEGELYFIYCQRKAERRKINPNNYRCFNCSVYGAHKIHLKLVQSFNLIMF
jgi:hypothetical protein